MGRLNKRVRGLEGGRRDETRDPAWRARYSYYRKCMRVYSGTLSQRGQAEAARRLASCRETAVDRVQAAEAAADLGLGPAPESTASRAADEDTRRRYEEWKAAQEDYFDPKTGIARHLLTEDPERRFRSGG